MKSYLNHTKRKPARAVLCMLTALMLTAVSCLPGVTDTSAVYASNWNMTAFLKAYPDAHFNLKNEPERAMTKEEYIAVIYAYSYYGKGSPGTYTTDRSGRQPSAWCAPYVQAEVNKGTVKPSELSYTDPATVAFAAEFLARSKGLYSYDFNNFYSFTGTESLSPESKMFLNVAVDAGLIAYTPGMNASRAILRKEAGSFEVPQKAVSLKPAAASKKFCMRDTAVFFPDTYWDFGLADRQFNELKSLKDSVTMVTFASSYVNGSTPDRGNSFLNCDFVHEPEVLKYNGRQDPQVAAAEWCHENGKLALLGVCNAGNTDAIYRALSSESSMDTLASEIAAAAAKNNLDGVNMDIEIAYGGAPYRSAYASLIKKLSSKLHAEDKVLMVSTGAYFTLAQEQASFYDYAAMASAADYVNLILYDDYPDTSYSYSRKAGSMSNIVRIGRVMRYAASVIPSYKLQLGMSGFAVDYNTTAGTARDIPYDTALSIKSRYGASMVTDTAEDGGHFSYTAADGQHVVYLETASGINNRLELVNRYNFNGINAYYLGSGCSQLYASAASYASYHKEIISAMSEGLVPASLRCRYNEAITRADFCSLVVNLIESAAGCSMQEFLQKKNAASGARHFTDTSDSSVLAVSALGIVTGYDDGTFRPTRTISRREAAAILQRLAAALDCSPSGAPLSFTDTSGQPEWAMNGINFVTACLDPSSGSRVMNGTGSATFSPAASYTREQSYMTMIRLLHAAKR